MMNLAEYRRRSQSLADFLPWAALVEKGVILNKDGSLPAHRAVPRAGPRIPRRRPNWSPSPAGSTTRCAASARAGRSSSRRSAIPANRYPESDFPDAASRLVDAERRAQFEEEGAHFESRYFLTLLWLPPPRTPPAPRAWLYEGRARDGADWRAALAGFIDRTDRVLALIEGFMPEAEWLDDAETLTYLHSCISTKPPARPRSRNPDASRRHPGRRGSDRRPRATARQRASAHAHHHGLPVADLAGPARRPEPAGLSLSLVHARHLPRQDRRHQGARPHPPAMVRQAQIDHGDPEGGDDQRSVGADGLRRRQQGAGRRSALAGTRLRSSRPGLCHRHRHGLGRRSARRRGTAAPGREGHPGPRLHLHARDGQRDRGLARQPARPCLRQCPPAADLDAQPRPHDAVLGGMGRAGTGRAFSRRRRCSSRGPKARRRSGSPCMSAMSATR